MFDDIQYRLLVDPLDRVYPELDETYPCLDDYGPLLRSMGFEIILKIDDTDYSGDSRVLFKHGDHYGMLIFGWGSCSGCDALQACETAADVEALRHTLFNDIQWGTARDLHDWMLARDWRLQWCFHSGTETQEFIDQATAMLDGIARQEHLA